MDKIQQLEKELRETKKEEENKNWEDIVSKYTK